MAGIYAIRQLVTATNQFDGTAPGTTPVDAGGVRTYPTATAGGLFEFSSVHPTLVAAILLYMDDPTSWSVVIGDALGDMSVASGANESSWIMAPPEELVLLPSQTIKVVTSGATGAMHCTVMFGSSHKVSWADKI